MSESITAKAAQGGIEAAVKRATQIGVPMSIAIIDSGRALVGFLRMDKALLGSIEIAQAKAFTARTVNARTSDLMPLVQPGAPFYGLEVSHRQPMVIFGGGVPITHRGEVIGAIGVSGGSAEQDVDVAEAGARFLQGLETF
ncbi:heme-binding protein [Mesorhizobium sp. B3-1-6]|uniref:GlcG/HbpS family heme-binding protein n=1 Tax=Mesorhizobium sp. B3-1-6 TaxID=2589895 RepID=UPI00112C75C8|nr:heme-binding protein [Mesorhizobium sp. B3-1-6]TPI41331.1 heme-binding protein [Mesorhizobium sp. B3-1-6]